MINKQHYTSKCNLLSQQRLQVLNSEKLVYIEEMKTIFDIRRDNLLQLVDKHKTKANVSRLGRGANSGFISQICNGDRQMGEKAARKLEEQLDIAPGYFDLNQNGDNAAVHLPLDLERLVGVITEVEEILSHSDTIVEPIDKAKAIAICYSSGNSSNTSNLLKVIGIS